jgi:copper oxidase (laccase) domain-containing protein
MTGTAVEFLTSPRLEVPGVRHAFFTRKGGVSTGIYASLNLGRGSGDDPG